MPSSTLHYNQILAFNPFKVQEKERGLGLPVLPTTLYTLCLNLQVYYRTNNSFDIKFELQGIQWGLLAWIQALYRLVLAPHREFTLSETLPWMIRKHDLTSTVPFLLWILVSRKSFLSCVHVCVQSCMHMCMLMCLYLQVVHFWISNK